MQNKTHSFSLFWLLLCQIWMPNGFAEEPLNGDTRFWHLAIVVEDMERMHDFYSRILGLKNVSDLAFSDAKNVHTDKTYQPVVGLDGLMAMQETKVKIRHYTDPGHQQFLELMYYPDHPASQVKREMYKPLGWNHLGLQVSSMDHILNIIRKESIGTIIGGPTVLNEFGANRYVLLKDPEGNIVELYEPTKQ